MTDGSSRRAWAVLVGCFLISTGYMAYALAPASILPVLVERFQIDKPSAGLSISAIYLGWAILQLPGGWLMDRYDNRWLVGLSVAVFVIASVVGVFLEGFTAFLVTRFVAGGGAAFIWTASTNIVNRTFPAGREAFGTSLFVASAPAGVAIAQFGGPPIAAAVGWKAVFLTYTMVAILGVPILALAARAPVRNETQLSLRGFVRSLRRPAILLLSLSSFCTYFLFLFFNSWMPTYAAEVLAIDLAAAGAASALVPIAGLVARPGGGWLADHVGGYRPVIIAGFALSLPVLGGLAFVDSSGPFAVLLFLAGIGSQLAIGVFYVYAVDLTVAAASGTSLALLTTVSVFGSLSAPVAGGWLIDAFSWQVAFAVTGTIALLGIAAAMLVPARE